MYLFLIFSREGCLQIVHANVFLLKPYAYLCKKILRTLGTKVNLPSQEGTTNALTLKSPFDTYWYANITHTCNPLLRGLPIFTT
jgi:hypothetical protein